MSRLPDSAKKASVNSNCRFERRMPRTRLRRSQSMPHGAGCCLLMKMTEGTINDVRIAQRGDPDGRLKRSVDPAIASFATSVDAYLDTLHAFIDTGAESARQPGLSYASAVNSALDTWDITQKQLDQLRVSTSKIWAASTFFVVWSLIGAPLGTLGLLVAFFDLSGHDRTDQAAR